jgi:hypothetical protein
MSAEPTSDLKFEIGHVLFIDIVGYSKLLPDEQRERIRDDHRNQTIQERLGSV